MVDHVSDSLESSIPLTVLVKAAKADREKEVGRLNVLLLLLLLSHAREHSLVQVFQGACEKQVRHSRLSSPHLSSSPQPPWHLAPDA